ncbi:MAG: hypothetical protein ACREFA_20645 [Stellaceae bacterium]
MKIWVSTAVALLMILPAASAAAKPCRPKASRHCLASSSLVDLTAVPAISQRIIAREPVAPPPQPRGASSQPAEGYNGPTVGVPNLGRGATLGYHWSLH